MVSVCFATLLALCLSHIPLVYNIDLLTLLFSLPHIPIGKAIKRGFVANITDRLKLFLLDVCSTHLLRNLVRISGRGKFG